MASALPIYQCLPRRCCAGTGATKLPSSGDIRHVRAMWVSSECDLYWVSTTMCRYREFTRFDRAKSTNRYVPPNGTDGLARAAVRGHQALALTSREDDGKYFRR